MDGDNNRLQGADEYIQYTEPNLLPHPQEGTSGPGLPWVPMLKSQKYCEPFVLCLFLDSQQSSFLFNVLQSKKIETQQTHRLRS